MNPETRKVDVLAELRRQGVTAKVHDAVAELIAGAEDARSALHSCIDALTSDEQSDYDALNRVTAALARVGSAA